MPIRTLLAPALSVIFLSLMPAAAGYALEPVATQVLQAGTPAQPRYELGAVVDVRRANPDGLAVLAVTPGGAADTLGLQPGDLLRSVNGHRLQGVPKPSPMLESALQEGNGRLQVEALRDGKTLRLTGRAGIAGMSKAGIGSCGYVSTRTGVVPRVSENIFLADLTQIDGRSTPLQRTDRHRVVAGKHVLVVRELIDPAQLNSAQLLQIAKMKKFAFARAYKSLIVDVKPGMNYRVGARLIKDRLDTQSIRDNAYWEPVVWEKVPEACP